MGEVVSLNEARLTLHPKINLYCRVINEQRDDFDFSEFAEGDIEGIKDFASFEVGIDPTQQYFNPKDHLAETYFHRMTETAKEQGTTSPHTYEKLCNFSRRLLRYCQDHGVYYRFIENESL